MLTKQIQRRSRGSSYKPPAIANDNIRARVAVNDNLDVQELEDSARRKARPALPKLPKTARWLGRALRVSPYFIIGGYAFDYLMRQATDEYTFTNVGSWYKDSQCASQKLTTPIAFLRTAGHMSHNSSFCTVGNGVSLGLPFFPGNPFNALLPTSHGLAIANHYYAPGMTNRGVSNQVWLRPIGSPFSVPDMLPPRKAAVLPQIQPDPVFELARTYAPEITPLNYIQFAHPPSPRWADAPHWEHPFRQVSNGTKPDARLKPYEQALDWKLEISNSPIPKSDLIHKRVPPTSSTKERKIKLSGKSLAAWHAVGAATEAVDFINVVYKNLPRKFKNGEKTPQDKLAAIAQGWHEIDLLDLTADIISMQIEDRIYGELGKGLGEVSKKLNLPVGFGVSSIYKTIRYASGGVSN